MLIYVLTLLTTLLLFWNIPLFPKGRAKNEAVSLSMIIPARNEEKNLPALLQSLPSLTTIEVIVVDDHSTDRTKEVAEANGATVITPPPLPAGWLGKSWACWNGAHHATKDVLLFVDADVTFEQGGLSSLQAWIGNQSNHHFLLTVHPYHQMVTLVEKLSMMFHLVVIGSLGGTLPFQNTFNGGHGQVLSCRRADYFEWGGHESIRGDIVENLSFTQRGKEKGAELTSLLGKGMVSMRMYPNGFRQLIKGWSKSIASGASHSALFQTLIVASWIALLSSFFTSFPTFTSQLPPYGFVFGACLILVLWRVLKEVGTVSIFNVFLFPLSFALFLGVFTYSLMTTFLFRSVQWKGRNVTVHGKGREQ